MEKVAVVILNWNGKNWLEKFLPNVIECSPEATVIVADNASTDGSQEFLRSQFPQVTLVGNDENGGFAKGYNDALKRIEAIYYLLLNSDIEVTPNWLSPLLETMDQHADVVACQPKVLAYHAKDTFEHAGAAGGFIDRNYFPFCRGRIMDHVEVDNGQYDSPIEVFWASGACLLIRSEAYHNAGGFDEEFFAHMEEIDLCWRLKRSGHKIMVVPASTVYHVGGGTLSYTSPRKVYLNFRNSLMMIVKNHEGWLFPKLIYRMTLDGVAATKFLLTGEFKNFWAVFRSHVWLYGHCGSQLKKRKSLRTNSSQFNRAGLYAGSILWAYFFKRIKHFDALNQRLFK